MRPNRSRRALRQRSCAFREALERLEPRCLLAGASVTTTDDLSDGDTSSIANLLANPGPTGISLREAITATNNSAGADVVNFNIPGAGPHTLALNKALPSITDTLTINGYTQDGAQANTLPLGNNAIIKIELSGAGGIGVGLNVQAPDCVIQGLSMTAFEATGVIGSAAIQIEAAGAVVQGNWLGIRPDATISGNRRGVISSGLAVNALIGGTTPAARNVVSGNGLVGIELVGGNSRVQGNFVGTNPPGSAAAPNGTGVRIRGIFTRVGGPGVGGRNIISGNSGIGLDARGIGHSIEHNFIGPGANGEQIGNGGDGVRLSFPLVSDRIISIGEKDAFNAPVIAYNAGDGIDIAQGQAAIKNVAIHNNGGLGIRGSVLGGFILNSAQTTSTNTVVTGSISGLFPGEMYVIHFYGNGPGGQFEAVIGSLSVTADANGNVESFIAVLDACGLAEVTATVSFDRDFDFTDPLVGKSAPIANNRPPVIEITTAAGSGAGSIVAAFTAANGTPGPEVILFNIPGSGFLDITPASSITPFLSRINDVLLEGRGQGLGGTLPRTYINVNNGLGTFNGGANNTVAGVGFYNVSGRALDADGSNNTYIQNTIGIGAAEQPLGVSSIVQSDVVRILGGNNNRILGNAIHAGRDNACVAVYGGTNHLVHANLIGITQSGVVFGGSVATNNRVGVVINDGTGTDVTDNTIAGITQDAIKVGEFGFPGGSGHTFTGNRMFQNQLLGIDLKDDGVTPNGPAGGPRPGPNGLQNYPVINSAEQVPGGVRITGNFVSDLNLSYAAEAFASSLIPAININEGGRSLGTFNIVTDGDGDVPFDVTVPGGAIFGETILVIATNPDGSTSEFSINVNLFDNLAPSVSDGEFEFETGHALSWDVSEIVTGVSTTDVDVVRLPSDPPTNPQSFQVVQTGPDSYKLIFGLPSPQQAADGNYQATFQPKSIQDAAGNLGPPVSRGGDGGNPRVIDFFIFAGDANRDRVIDIGDFAILAGNFNEEGFYSDGDFDYSELVDIGDFAILASKFNQTLPALSEPERAEGPAPANAPRLAAASPPPAQAGFEARPESSASFDRALDGLDDLLS